MRRWKSLVNRLALGLLLSAGLVTGGANAGDVDKPAYPLPADPSPADPSIAILAADGFRRPWLQPFNAQSVWNLPIGSGVVWSGRMDPDTQHLNGVHAYINAEQWSQPFYIGTSQDPLITVKDRDGSHISPVSPQQIHIPISAIPASAADKHINLFDLAQPNKNWSYYGCSFDNGADVSSGVTCWMGAVMDSCGDGLGTIEGTSEFNFGIGTIRHADLVQGSIHHVLRMSASRDLLKSPNPISWQKDIPWPDVIEDDFGPKEYIGNLLFGSTIGIPRDVDLAEIGLSSGGMMLAQALQNYGAIIRDSGGSNQIAFYAEPQDAHNEIYIQMAQDAEKLAPYLRIMRNQSPASINGGGTRPLALAAPLDPKYCLAPPAPR